MEEKKENKFVGNLKTAVKQREVIIALVIALVVGLILGLVAMYFLNPISLAKFKYGEDTVVSFENQSLSSEELYNTMKKHYSIEMILEEIDQKILDAKYTLDDTMKQEVSDNADSFIAYYQAMYQYSEEEIYKALGFQNREELEQYLRLDYERTLYLYDYIESKLESGAVEKYYEENKDNLTQYDSKHILVKTSDTVTEEQALATAQEIITKLNEGKTYDDIVAEYGDGVTAEELGYYSSTDGLETSYFEGLAALEDGTYSKEPVQTSYGYHIIFKLGTKSELKDVRRQILDVLSGDLKEEDPNYAYNALIHMRQEANIKFYDEDLEKNYQEYCDNYKVEETSTN